MNGNTPCNLVGNTGDMEIITNGNHTIIEDDFMVGLW